MGAKVTYGNEYQDQKQFDQFFATAFDRYDKNRDGKIDYKEYQPLINDMCKMIQNKYGSGPTLDKIKQAWMTLDKDRTGYLTRNEFSTRAKQEVEKILKQQGALPAHGQQGYGQQGHHPQQANPHGHGYPAQQGYGNQGYPPKQVPGYGPKGHH